MMGVYNRIGFERELRKKSFRKKEFFYVMVLDFDKIKEINDNFGYLNGDRYIISVVKIIKDEMDKIGFVGRIGGDEFVVFLENVNEYDIEKIKYCIKI